MKFKTLFIGLSCFTAFFYSCTNDSTETIEQTIEEVIEEPIEEIVENAPHDLELDNGEKWEVDKGMMVSIDSIALNINEFNGETMNDYGNFSTDLRRLTKTLISSCSMKGKSHDELHKWLLPFINLRKELDTITDLNQGNRILTDLTNELNVFNTYFK